MPIEIRELVIRATVNAGEETAGGAPPPDAEESSPRTHMDSDDDLVQTCVREVLRILGDKRER